MIRLRRVTPPSELTPEIVRRYTDAFIHVADKVDWAPKSVKKVIKRQLMAMGRKKCAYCEVRIGRNSEWAGCDHFRHKAKYRSLVLKWKNLLPCCPRCNSQKGTLDVLEKPIINPRFKNPSEFLFLEVIAIEQQIMTFLRGKSNQEIGLNTEIELGLNDYEIVNARDEYVSGLIGTVRDLAKIVELTRETDAAQEMILYVQERFAALLGGITPNNQYAGTASSLLFILPEFVQIHQFLIAKNAWSAEMEKQLQSAKKHQLDCIFIQT